MQESKVKLIGIYLKPEYLENKDKFVKDVEYVIRQYVSTNGKKPTQINMNYSTQVKVMEIMKVVGEELVGVCDLEPNYDAVMRDDYVFVSDGSI